MNELIENMDKNELIENIDKLHTTEMGIERIKRNLSLEIDNVIFWCKEKILTERRIIERKGKKLICLY